jgi:hypothetical protein
MLLGAPQAATADLQTELRHREQLKQEVGCQACQNLLQYLSV